MLNAVPWCNERWPAIVFAALCAGLLGGCAHSAITPAASDPELPTQWTRGGESAAVAPNWLESFENPELTALVTEAMAGNYSLELERARLYESEQALVVAGSERLPTLNLSAGATHRDFAGADGGRLSTNTYGVDVSAVWDVDLWGRLSKQEQAAQLAVAGQAQRVESSRRDLAGATAAAYYRVAADRQLLEVAQRRLQNVTQSHDIVASGYRQGLNDALDLYLARNQVEREKANWAQQQQTLTESIADLQLLLARYPDGSMDTSAELPILADNAPVGLPSELLTRRTDLQEAWLNLLATDASLAAAHKARFPSLSLVAGGGVSSVALSDLLDADLAVWSLTGNLAQTVFSAGRLAAREEQAYARVRQAEQQYLELLFRAFAEVENAISRGASLRQRYEAFLEADANSRAALDLALKQYQRGLVTYTTVLESQRQAFDAEATVVQLRNELLQNRIDLYLALGGAFGTE